MWVFTVAVETCSLRAISALLSPSAMRSSTSISRAVSPSGGSDGAAGAGSACARRSSSRLWMPGERPASPESTLCTARTISSPPASLVRQPRAPASRAGDSDSSSANVVRTTTCLPECSARILRVASTPSQRGMRRSISTTFGASPATSATASSPSRGSDNLDPGQQTEQHHDALPHHGLIVGDHHPSGLRLGLLRHTGTFNVTTNPSSPGPASREPPSNSAHSRMPSRPCPAPDPVSSPGEPPESRTSRVTSCGR